MALDCQDVPSHVTYNCSNPWGLGCTIRKGFDFISLWNYTLSIQRACPTDSRLFRAVGGTTSPSNASLTQDACVAIAGGSYTVYPAVDIWQRLTTWKFPLVQLVFVFPRPPLSFWAESLVILHLVGDPIDTIRNLVLKLSTCQEFARYWQEHSHAAWARGVQDQRERDLDWKALALITDAFAEWGLEHEFTSSIQGALFLKQDDETSSEKLREIILQTAQALAADRSTKVLPVSIAQLFFIATIGIAFGRTKSASQSSDPNDSSNQVFINVEVHSVAISALYFWIIPCVIFASIIGVSQTKSAIPRILKRFRAELLPEGVDLPINEIAVRADQRVYHGGIYTWQAMEHQEPHSTPYPKLECKRGSRLTRLHSLFCGSFAVTFAVVTATLISYKVPSQGWDCRHVAEVSVFVVWILSFLLNGCLNYVCPISSTNGPSDQKLARSRKILLVLTMTKDAISVSLTLAGVIATQVGVLNRCDCYTNWATGGVALPVMPEVNELLQKRLSRYYPAISFSAIAIQLVFVPLYLCSKYYSALRVFIQRDDCESNIPDRLRNLFLAPAKTRPRQTRSFHLEEGSPGHQSELQESRQAFGEASGIEANADRDPSQPQPQRRVPTH